MGNYNLLKKIKLDIFFGEGNYMQYLYVIVETEYHKQDFMIFYAPV